MIWGFNDLGFGDLGIWGCKESGIWGFRDLGIHCLGDRKIDDLGI